MPGVKVAARRLAPAHVRDAKGGTFGVVGEGRGGNTSLDSYETQEINQKADDV